MHTASIGTVRALYDKLRSPEPSERESPPRVISDSKGRSIRIRRYDDDDFESLLEFYESFAASQRSQGTPPLGAAAIRDWLGTVLDGISLLACRDGRPVGHVMFVPDGEGSHEVAIFVHQEYQRAGIGTELLETGLQVAQEAGLPHVWVTVAASNGGAQKLYSDCGFIAHASPGPTRRMTKSL